MITQNEGNSSQRRRATRACDACKIKRQKCEDFTHTEEGVASCRLCRTSSQICKFSGPTRKRGPPKGYQKDPDDSDDSPLDNNSQAVRLETPMDLNWNEPHPRVRSPSPQVARGPDFARLGLPTSLVDSLLSVYFTHVHNVWPVIYKPLFDPATTSIPLLLSMLCVAACVAGGNNKGPLPLNRLFDLAERHLHHQPTESRLDLVQAMILLSLRQTGNGNKDSAHLYAARASGMALNLGLNLASNADSASPSKYGSEVRSRVFWNCYILDKTLAEETGRPFLLPYRRVSTPLPSLNELDELEMWPPLPMSSSPVPSSVQHVRPRRGHVMSCFLWTCRLAMIVEDILDLDSEVTPSGDWSHQWLSDAEKKRQRITKTQWLGAQLQLWKDSLPPHLQATESRINPLPHHVISLAWHATALVLLYSRFMAAAEATQDTAELQLSAHAKKLCFDASQETVDLLLSLDHHHLLREASADVIHILSLATLLEAFKSGSSNPSTSASARINFDKCCNWLRDFSRSWPAASSHKVFFEALIASGDIASTRSVEPYRGHAMSTSPAISDGLSAILQRLPPARFRPPALVNTTVPVPSFAGGSGLLQLPQLFWNHFQGSTSVSSKAQLGAQTPETLQSPNQRFGITPVAITEPRLDGLLGHTLPQESESENDVLTGLLSDDWINPFGSADMSGTPDQQSVSDAFKWYMAQVVATDS